MTENEVRLRAQVPLRRPVASITSAVTSVGIPLPSGREYRRWYQPSYIQAAFRPQEARGKVLENEIITFDGLVIPLRKCHCKVTLAEAKGIKLVISKPRPETTEMEIISEKGSERVTLYQIQGKEPKVDGLQQSGMIRKRDMTLIKERNGPVKVETKPFKIIADQEKIVVEAKPASYNQVRGVMGTHDGERSTDKPRHSEVSYRPGSYGGVHHLSPKSAKELLDQYKLDRSCKIPPQ